MRDYILPIIGIVLEGICVAFYIFYAIYCGRIMFNDIGRLRANMRG